MNLNNEFTVAAPLDQTWAALLDMERVAGCLPGAKLQAGAGGDVFRGEMKVKLGPMALAYTGTATIVEVDEDLRTTSIDVRGKETKGSGTVSASIRSRLEPQGEGSTRVVVETGLNVTGRPAQFGRGMMEDVAAAMLQDFAKRLEGEILNGGAASPAPTGVAKLAPGGDDAAPATATGTTVPSGDDDVLDLGSVLSRSLLAAPAARARAGLASVLLVLLVGALLRRRSRRGLDIRYRW